MKSHVHARRSRWSPALLLAVVLPLLVVLASALLLTLAGEAGFTPLPGAERLVGTR